VPDLSSGVAAGLATHSGREKAAQFMNALVIKQVQRLRGDNRIAAFYTIRIQLRQVEIVQDGQACGPSLQNIDCSPPRVLLSDTDHKAIVTRLNFISTAVRSEIESPGDTQQAVSQHFALHPSQRHSGQHGVEAVIPATTHLWVRHSEPDRVYEEDLISVWSRARELRAGLVEFDVSKLADGPWKSARLELGTLNTDAIRQTARLIPPGIDQATWSSYQQTKVPQGQPLQSFGRIEAESGAGTVGQYTASQAATEADLKLLNHARQNGRITLALVADDDGTAYSRDWDDGSRKNNIPRLVLRYGTSNSDEAALRALENVCHAIMNSADFLYID